MRSTYIAATLAITLVLCLSTAIQRLPFTSASMAQSPQDRTDGKNPSMELTVRKPDGSGLAGCSVRLTGRIGKKRVNETQETSKDGIASIEYDEGSIAYYRISISEPGYVPVHYSWDSDNTDVSLPEALTIQLKTGKEIRGLVLDEDKNPIANASVRLSMPITWPPRDSYYFGLATLQTDAEGKWSFADAPKDAGRVSIRVSHPDYKQRGSGAMADLTTIVLEQGISFPGRVVDTDGQPISGAIARLGPDRWGTDEPEDTTNDNGIFELKNCEAGKDVLTVQAPGYSPQLIDVEVQEGDNEPVKVSLAPPHTLKIRIVDTNGKPIPDASVAVDGWRGYRTLEHRGRTNAKGEATWNSAPAEALICDIFKPGYMAGRDTTCIPGEKTNVVTLYPELEITGRVIDREGEKPVDSFRIIRGQNQSNLRETYWRSDETHEFRDGRFKFTFDEPMQSWQLKVIAEGFKPKTSREFKSTEGKVRYSFLLERASQLSGRVVDANGVPVHGAKVVVASSGNRVSIRNGFLDERRSAAKPVSSQKDGSFRVTLPDEGFYLLLAIHDKGFVELAKQDVVENQTLQLQPWSSISGVAKLGDKLDAERDIKYSPQRPRDGRSYGMVEYEYETSTDVNGEFSVQRLFPGEGTISRILVVDYGTGSLHSPGWQIPIKVAPGSKQELEIGGTGFKVTGSFGLSRQPPAETNWKFEPAVSFEAFNEKTGNRVEPYTRYSGRVLEDGTFEVHDIPAGYYQVRMEVQAIGAQKRIAGKLGTLRTFVSITEENADVGELVIPLDDTLEPGEAMPVFVAETSTGQLLDSRNIRNVVIFANFWSSYSKESMGQTAQLKNVLEEFGDEERLVCISLATEDQLEAAWEEIETRGWNDPKLRWLHAYAGPRFAKTCKSFCLKKMPANFLFAPNGTLVAKDIPLTEVSGRIKKLLADEDFSGEPVSTEPRFKLETFDSQQRRSSKTRPAVFVVEDGERNEEVKADEDSLIAFDEELNEQWRLNISNIYSGGPHKLLLDRENERLYVCEAGDAKLTALDLNGNRLWQISEIDSSCGAIDTKTGNIWVSGGNTTTHGETVILDSNGKEQFAIPYRALDMIYHPESDTFWLIGKHLIVVKRDGSLVSRARLKGHAYQSISRDSNTGRIWITERDHPDVAGSANRIHIFSSTGEKEKVVDTGEMDPYTIECIAGNKTLFGGYNSGLQVATVDKPFAPLLPGMSISTDDGENLPETEAGYRVQSISQSESSEGRVWIVTPKSLLRLDDLKVTARADLQAKYSATVVAY